MTTREAADEIRTRGYCVLRHHFPASLIDACREGFWPILLDHLATHREEPNRGLHRYFVPMPFDPPCFSPAFFFDQDVLAIVRAAMDDTVVADQWGCDVPLYDSVHQDLHLDYRRPLFPEAPGLELPIYMLVVSFGLVPVTRENGPIEILPGSHNRRASDEEIQPVTLDIGDVLIRHPWALHRGSPNRTDQPRPLASIRYVRRWYVDESREVNVVPRHVRESLTPDQQRMLRFPVGR